MNRYWPASEIAQFPGLHKDWAHEIAASNKTGLISDNAMNIAGQVAGNMIGYPMPLVLVWQQGATPRQVFLRHPTEWEFHKLERAGVVHVSAKDGMAYIADVLH